MVRRLPDCRFRRALLTAALGGIGILAPLQPAAAQPAAARPPQAAPAPPVDGLTVARLVWSSLAALDHANRTGNYSVLRDLGAPGFQANNSPATLAGIFEAVRTQQIDLSYSFNVSPSWDFAPAILQNGLLRARGQFPLRPTAIGFDMLFENVGGQWRLFGISVAPQPISPPPQQQPQPRSRR
jgi:hypothetical protein